MTHLNDAPFALVSTIVLFDRVDVLSCMISNSTEDIDVFLRERARGVVVSSNVKIWHLKPEVDIGVVHLALDLRIVLLLS